MLFVCSVYVNSTPLTPTHLHTQQSGRYARDAFSKVSATVVYGASEEWSVLPISFIVFYFIMACLFCEEKIKLKNNLGIY